MIGPNDLQPSPVPHFKSQAKPKL